MYMGVGGWASNYVGLVGAPNYVGLVVPYATGL